jgi:hypothetical protein
MTTPKQFVPHFTGGNAKLKKDGIVTFNLPAGKTCPKAGICRSFCYACKGNYQYPSVAMNAEGNLVASRHRNFVAMMILECQDLLDRGLSRVRFHSSGDFYSQDYLDKWVAVMTVFPEITFYAYTKSLHLDWSEADKLPNFVRIQSEGGLMDDSIDKSKPHARVFQTAEELAAAGYVNGTESDLVAMRGTVKIGLVRH